LLDSLGNCPAVLGLKRNGLEDQQVERSLNKIVRPSHTMIIYTADCR
jgi:hypothetical protein